MTKHIQWDGTLSQEGFDILKGEGGCIVCPTKVGYIIMTSDKAGLERKFEAKERNRNKPGVVLCGSMDELRALAQLNPEIETFYQKHWDEDILLGCILPWKPEAPGRWHCILSRWKPAFPSRQIPAPGIPSLLFLQPLH